MGGGGAHDAWEGVCEGGVADTSLAERSLTKI